jgi:hypothetical protein
VGIPGLEYEPTGRLDLQLGILRTVRRVGLVVAIPLVALSILAPLTHFGGAGYAGIIICSVVLDFLLTFDTPELAFRSRSAVHALDTASFSTTSNGIAAICIGTFSARLWESPSVSFLI